jgi:hypothetical protein
MTAILFWRAKSASLLRNSTILELRETSFPRNEKQFLPRLVAAVCTEFWPN